MVSRFSSLLVAGFLCLSLLGHRRTIASTSPKFTQQATSSPLEVTQKLSSPKITLEAASPLEVTQHQSSPKISSPPNSNQEAASPKFFQQAASSSSKFTQQAASLSPKFSQQALSKSSSPKFTQQALSMSPKFTQQALSSPTKITQQTVSPTHQRGSSPPKFTQQPTWPKQTYYDEDGPPIILDCNIEVDDSVTILWFKDGQPLSSAMLSWQISNNNQTLTLDPPKNSQTGTYMCYIYNTAGNISYSNYVFIAGRTAVTQPRVIETNPAYQVIHATLGDNVTMFCVFDVGGASTGLLDLTLNWVKNGTLVKDSDHTTWDVSSTLENNQVFYLNISNLKESDSGDYKCVGSNSAGNDSRVLAVSPPQPRSGQDHAWMIVLGSVGGVFLIGTVAMAMLCYHRNQVRNKYQQFDWPDTDLDNYDVPEGELKYDVFVSYSSEDQDWVMNSLFQTMTENSYEVCIDFKDFTPGMAISENILEAIYKSRKVIVVLSQSFLKSMWGQFELSQALNRAVIQRKDVLILLRYDSCKVPAKLMGKTFLDWTSQDVRPHFWKRLFESVGEPGNYGNQRRTEETRREPDICRKEMQEVCVEMNGNVRATEDEGLGIYDLESDKTGVYCTEDVEATGSEAGVMVNDINRKHAMTYSMESDKAELLGNDLDIIDIHGSSIKI